MRLLYKNLLLTKHTEKKAKEKKKTRKASFLLTLVYIKKKKNLKTNVPLFSFKKTKILRHDVLVTLK